MSSGCQSNIKILNDQYQTKVSRANNIGIIAGVVTTLISAFIFQQTGCVPGECIFGGAATGCFIGIFTAILLYPKCTNTEKQKISDGKLAKNVGILIGCITALVVGILFFRHSEDLSCVFFGATFGIFAGFLSKWIVSAILSAKRRHSSELCSNCHFNIKSSSIY